MLGVMHWKKEETPRGPSMADQESNILWALDSWICHHITLDFISRKQTMYISSIINFKLKTLAGTDLSLTDNKVKGFILNFWGTFCKPWRKKCLH
jgi:hypothetical protein